MKLSSYPAAAKKSASDVVDGLKRHAGIWAVMGWCTEFFKQESWRSLGFPSLDEFMSGFMESYFTVMDPNTLLCMAWKWQRGDVSRITSGNLEKAFKRIKAKVFVMPIDEDMFFPPRDCEAEQKMISNSEFRVIHTYGHLGLLKWKIDPYIVDNTIIVFFCFAHPSLKRCPPYYLD